MFLGHRRARAGLIFCVAVLAACLTSESQAEKGRTLGGYRFIPANQIQSPFITTNFTSVTGVAIASGVDVPFLIINTTPPDTLINLEGDLLFIAAHFGYEYAVDPRVALRLRLNAVSRLGTSGQAMLSQGISVLKGGELGGTVELWRRERMLLSGLLDVRWADALAVDLVQFVEDVVANGPENASIVTTVDGVSITGGVAFAWAANPWSGTTAVLQLGENNLETSADGLLWRLAGTASVDFGQNDKAPIGLLLTLDIDELKPQSENSGTDVGVGLGVFYTGREDFHLGIEAEWSRIRQVTRDVTINPTTFDLVLRYYF